jgi:hypothetical protein
LADELQDARGRNVTWKTAEFAKALKRLLQAPMERRAAYFLSPELSQMVGDELRVEQAKAAISQPSSEIDKRDLAGVRFVREHALAEESASKRHSIEAPDQLAVSPALDGMAKPHFEEFGVKLADTFVDPGSAPARTRGGAAFDDALIVAIGANLELVVPDNARKPLWNVHVIEGENASALGLDPVKGRVAGAFGHWENAAGIGF